MNLSVFKSISKLLVLCIIVNLLLSSKQIIAVGNEVSQESLSVSTSNLRIGESNLLEPLIPPMFEDYFVFEQQNVTYGSRTNFKFKLKRPENMQIWDKIVVLFKNENGDPLYFDSRKLENGYFIFESSIPTSFKKGTYKFDNLHIIYQLGYNYNYSWDYRNLKNAQFSIVDGDYDIIKPVIDLTSIQFNKREVSSGDLLQVIINIMDNDVLEKIEYIWKNENGFRTKKTIVNGDVSDEFVINFPISESTQSGLWTLESIVAQDISGNKSIADFESLGIDTSFVVKNELSDSTLPLIDTDSFRSSRSIIETHDNVTLMMKADDIGSGVGKIVIELYNSVKNDYYTIESYDKDSIGYYNFLITSEMRGYHDIVLCRITIYDKNNNYRIYDINNSNFDNLIPKVVEKYIPQNPIKAVMLGGGKWEERVFTGESTIDGDLYVGNADLTVRDRLTVNGNIYVMGNLYLDGDLDAFEIHGYKYYEYSNVVFRNGNHNYTKLNLTNRPEIRSPILFLSDPNVDESGCLQFFEVATVPYGDFFINGQKYELNDNGTIYFKNFFVGARKELVIKVVDPYGYEHIETFQLNNSNERKLESIFISKYPDKRVYYVGENFQMTGLEVLGDYSDGAREKINITMDNIFNFNSDKPDENQSVLIKYDGVYTYCDIKIQEDLLKGLELKQAPSKTQYFRGEQLNLNGLKVLGQYESGRVAELIIGEENISGFDSRFPTIKQDVTVNILGKTVTFSVDILDILLESIEVTKQPTKLNYFTNEPLDLSGLEVTGTYNNGEKRIETVTLDHIKGFDSSKPQMNEIVSVKINEKETSFIVQVIENELESIIIKGLPLKMNYYVGDTLDLTGLVVEGTYLNGEMKIMEFTESNVTGYDASKPYKGQVITVTVNGKTDTFSIDILANPVTGVEITRMPDRLQYVEGQNLDLAGLEVTATFTSGKVGLVDVTEDQVTGFDSSRPTESQVLTITIEDKTVTFNVTIIPKELVSLEVTKTPQFLVYEVGQDLDLTGLEVTGLFSNDTREVLPVTMGNITGYDSSLPTEDQEITISISGKTAVFFVRITEKEPVKTIAGANRYGTAVEVSKASYANSDVAILVQARNFPDALAAGPLAFMHNAPILLTNTDNLSGTTLAELERLGVTKVIIMGGEGAISMMVEKTLEDKGYEIERIAGANRYNTAVLAARSMEKKLGRRTKVVMASGNQFADALAAGSYAAKEGYPILLTSGKSLNVVTMEYLEGIEEVILVGGSGVISEEVRVVLEGMDIKVTRKNGANRSETSAVIGREYFGESTKAVIANGWEFADALAAAPYAAKIDAPIILVHKDRVHGSIAEHIVASKIKSIIVVGGDGAISEEVRLNLTRYIE